MLILTAIMVCGSLNLSTLSFTLLGKRSINALSHLCKIECAETDGICCKLYVLKNSWQVSFFLQMIGGLFKMHRYDVSKDPRK